MIPQIAGLALVVACVLLLVLVTFRFEARKRAKFLERFPPISDAEFLAMCPRGTNRAVALKVRRIVADQLGVEYERIYPSSSFVNDLGCE